MAPTLKQSDYYWRQYGAKKDPFPLLLDEADLNAIKSFQTLRQTIEQTIVKPSQLLGIYGPKGIGKTTFLQAILHEQQIKQTVQYIEADALLIPRKMVQLIHHSFVDCLDPETASDNTELADLTELKFLKTALLAIDHAERLPLESVKQLLNLTLLQQERPARLQVILIGDQGLEAKLSAVTRSATELSNGLKLVVMQPLDLSETTDYIHNCLKKAGLANPAPLNEDDIKLIYAHANGLLSHINRLAAQLMIDKLQKMTRIRGHVPKRRYQSIALGGVAIGLLIISLAYWLPRGLDGQNENSVVVAEAEQVVASVPTKAAKKSVVSQNEPTQVKKISSVQTQTTASAQHLPAPTTHIIQKAKPIKPAMSESTKVVSITKPNKSIVTTTPKQPQTVKQVAVLSSNITKPMARQSTSSQRYSANAQYLLSLQPSHYTVQLIGLSQLNDMQKFIHQHKLEKKAYYFKTQLNGHAWYILVLGNYKTLTAAENAKMQLPADLRRYQPWVRRLSAIHTVIKANANS